MLNHDTLQRIFDLQPSPSIILRPDTPVFTIVEVNEAYLNIADTTKEYLVGKGFFDAFPQNPYQDFVSETAVLNSVIEDRKSHSTPTRKYDYADLDGRASDVKYFKACNVPVFDADNKIEFIIRSIIDSTEAIIVSQKEEQAQNNLRETAMLMEQGQELARFGNWQWDIGKNMVRWSKELYNIYGLDGATFEVTFESYLNLLHPDDRQRVYEAITGVLDTRQDVVFEERIIRPNGEMRYLKSWGKVQTSSDGTPLKMIGACLDITESKLAEARLTDLYVKLEKNLQILAISEKRYSDIFHLCPLPMWVIDLDTLHFLDVNQAAIDHYGYSREEFLELTVNQLWRAEQIEEFETKITSNEESYSMSSTHVKKDGEKIQVFIQSNIINFNEKTTRLVVANDITERQNYLDAVEKQNAQLQEIAWIQSHVVRAPLARIMGLVELFKNYETTEIDKEHLLDNILNSAHELDGLIREISDKTEQILLLN